MKGLYDSAKATRNRFNKLRREIAKKERFAHLRGLYYVAALAEERDSFTASHLARIQAYSHALTQELIRKGVYRELNDRDFIEALYIGSALHDIGKVGIPDKILLKTKDLTKEEFEEMKTHTAIGGRVLQDVPHHTMVHDVAYYHHEKWDGTGYPEGLQGEKIPLAARIVAVVDVYDALRSERSYKKGYSHEKAIGIIEEGKAKHFDQKIVDTFLKINPVIDEIRNHNQRVKCTF